jgi:pimeloyl-ACP methyl ester carboxylesterase
MKSPDRGRNGLSVSAANRTVRLLVLALLAGSIAFSQTAQGPQVFAGRVRLANVRAVAGQSKVLAWPSGRRTFASVRVAQADPPLPFPPRVSVEREGELRILVPPTTPPGEYELQIEGSSPDGTHIAASTRIEVAAFTIPRSSTGRTPVVLLNGFQLDGCLFGDSDSTVKASSGTFGNLASFLANEEVPVAFFNNCSFDNIPIEDLSAQLRVFITQLKYDDGTSVDQQIDLICHSMGGLIARGYLSGIQLDGWSNSFYFQPPANPKIRKLVLIGTPNFGSFKAPRLGVQAPEMVPGSAFLWALSRWNQNRDDLRGVDALAIAGVGGSHYGAEQDDGVVSVTSASLGFSTQDKARTRIVPYCHRSPIVGVDCGSNSRGMAEIDTVAHLTWLILDSFLSDDQSPNAAWKVIGDQKLYNWISNYGGIYLALANADGSYVNDLTGVSFGDIKLENGGASNSIYYSEFVRGTQLIQYNSSWLGMVDCGTFTPSAGAYSPILCKYGPLIYNVSPVAPNVRGLLVASGKKITINGAGFGEQCADCKVLAYPGPTPVQVSSWSDTAVSVLLPGSYSGLVTLQVLTASGSDSINVVTSATAPAVTVTGRMVTGAIDKTSCARPSAATGFLTTDATAFLWYAVSGASSGDVPSVTWYTPNGPVYRQANWDPMTTSSGCFYDSIDIASNQPAYSPGNWSVRVAWNGSTLFTLNFTIAAPGSNLQPQITSLNPAAAVAGRGEITLIILGNNFLPNSTVTFNGVTRAATGNPDARQLAAPLTGAEVAKAGSYSVVVTNGTGSGVSNSFTFTVLDPKTPQPAVTSILTGQRLYATADWFSATYSAFTGIASGTYDTMVVFVPQATGNTYYYYDDPSDSNEWLHSTPRALRTGTAATGVFNTPSFQVTDDVPSGDYHIRAYFSQPGANQPVGTVAETDFSVATNTSAGGCFIATAAFGSPLAAEVQHLRDFRDRVLLRMTAGRAFVKWYYSWSPRGAEWLRARPFARKMTRTALWIPVAFAWLSLRTNTVFASVVFLALLLVLAKTAFGASMRWKAWRIGRHSPMVSAIPADSSYLAN